MEATTIAGWSAFFALCSLVVSGVNFLNTEKKFRDAKSKTHIDELRNGIIEVHKLALNAVIYSGEISKEHCENAVLQWEDLRARANEKWDLRSLEALSNLSSHLIEFTKQCVNEDLVDVDKKSETGIARIESMMSSRINLIDAFKTMSKKVKPNK